MSMPICDLFVLAVVSLGIVGVIYALLRDAMSRKEDGVAQKKYNSRGRSLGRWLVYAACIGVVVWALTSDYDSSNIAGVLRVLNILFISLVCCIMIYKNLRAAIAGFRENDKQGAYVSVAFCMAIIGLGAWLISTTV